MFRNGNPGQATLEPLFTIFMYTYFFFFFFYILSTRVQPMTSLRNSEDSEDGKLICRLTHIYRRREKGEKKEKKKRKKKTFGTTPARTPPRSVPNQTSSVRPAGVLKRNSKNTSTAS